MPPRPTDTQPSPASLRPEVGDADGGAGYNGADRPIISSKEQGSDAVSSAREAWLNFQLEHGAVISGGKVVVPKAEKAASTTSNRFLSSGDDDSGGTSGDWSSEGQRLYNRWQILESDNKAFVSESGAGAGRSYVETEEDKQDEVTRQFKDFLARAKGTYDLMADERSYAMAGDDQNIQNAKAVRDGVLNEAWGTPYADIRGPGLSSIIRPSLPNYLSPDYRMNDAVGLGGGEGFNDPDYDEYGMPMYAQGTEAAGGPVPENVLAMVGQPVFVPPDQAPPSGKPWPWGRRVV